MSFLTVELRTEVGEVLQQEFDEGAIARVRAPEDDPSSACLRFVDPYGDTVFNPRQAAVLSKELRAALQLRGDSADRERVARVIDLADRCAAGIHVYLWLIGD